MQRERQVKIDLTKTVLQIPWVLKVHGDGIEEKTMVQEHFYVKIYKNAVVSCMLYSLDKSSETNT